MPETKPLVAAAFICEKILVEEGNIYSAIRIVDTYKVKLIKIAQLKETVPRPTSIGDSTQLLDMSALVIVKAGTVTGKHEMSFRVRNPEGKETPFPDKFPVNFAMNDPAEGANATIRFVMPANANPGLYWIDVLWDGESLTSIPLKLVRESGSQGTA